MYKCTECGSEYKVKPEYCDCGNDEFVITVNEEPKPAAVKKSEVKKEPEVKKESVKKIPVMPKEEVKKEDIYKPQFRLHTDPVSLVIFIICLILSVIVLFLPIKTEETAENAVSTETKTSKNIPSIDKFWNNSLPIISEVKQSAPEAAVKVPEQKANAVKKPVNTVKSSGSTAKKPVQTKKTTPKQTVVKLQKSNNVQTVQQPKKTEEEIRAEAEKKALENAKKLEEVKKHAENLQKAMYDRQELANYKMSLRNTIGRKVDFTKVIGDGDCAISFKIDQNGRLVNGAFAKQSDNMTLNDAVYSAFMSSRNFTAPPDGYKNETLRLNVKFYNGNFEISLQ